mgnify:CR=1 FL=1
MKESYDIDLMVPLKVSLSGVEPTQRMSALAMRGVTPVILHVTTVPTSGTTVAPRPSGSTRTRACCNNKKENVSVSAGKPN